MFLKRRTPFMVLFAKVFLREKKKKRKKEKKKGKEKRKGEEKRKFRSPKHLLRTKSCVPLFSHTSATTQHRRHWADRAPGTSLRICIWAFYTTLVLQGSGCMWRWETKTLSTFSCLRGLTRSEFLMLSNAPALDLLCSQARWGPRGSAARPLLLGQTDRGALAGCVDTSPSTRERGQGLSWEQEQKEGELSMPVFLSPESQERDRS